MKDRLRRWLSYALFALFPASSFAANGLYTTGVGVVSSTMGGADIALSRDTSAVITNAAGLAQIQNTVTDYYATVFSVKRTSHDDNFTDRRQVSNEWGTILGVGHARHIDKYNTTVATGINVSGGFGYVYDNIGTVFGTTDNTHALFSLTRFSLAAGWQAREKLSFGFSAGLTYASTEQSLLPDTSAFDPATGDAFFGLDVDTITGWGVDVKLGLQYQFSPALRLGLIYGTTTNLPLEGSKLTVNYEALGLGRVDYKDVELDGFQLPQELGIGLAWQVRDDFLLSTQVAWYDWGRSIDNLTIEARNPRGPVPPGAESLTLVSEVNLRSRAAYSVGIEKIINPRFTLRLGYSYVPMIIPKENLSPTFALIPEHDISIGMGYKLDDKRTINTGLSLQPYQKVRYNNPQLPFGTSEEVNEAIVLHFMVSFG